MLLFEFLRAQDPTVTPETSKVHLACWNGHQDPLDVYYRGEFDEWQSWQNQANFERPYVVALISLAEAQRWLFVGVYASKGKRQLDDGTYEYELEVLPAYAEFAGRLFITFARTRASYLRGESCAPRMTVHAVTAEPVKLDEFPGFKTVDISFDDLDYLVRSGTTSWRTALGSVAGVYLISDTQTGKLYVGSATGEGGIWGRWCQYVDGHGNNVELRKLVGAEGIERAQAYRFSVLEIADTHAGPDEVLDRESHWKRVLLTRIHGWNAN
jgi:hypothetical protein